MDGADQLIAAAAAAAALTALTVPAAIATARRTGFMDSPIGYKAHRQPTPYLGGAAVIVATLAAIALLGVDLARFWPLLLGTFGLMVAGTIDDKVNLSPWLRLALEALAAALLWERGLGWNLFENDIADLLLTVFWIAAVVNGFNLMDNIDGAAASCACVSALALGGIGLLEDDRSIAVIGGALAGATAAFLRFNLARPARIFLGDGGSMAVGFLLAGTLMAAPVADLSDGPRFLAGCLIVGLPLFDTALVILSRRRRGAPVFSGATDHTTHRLNALLRSPRSVCCVLIAAQAGLCGLAIEVSRLGSGATVATACFAALLGGATIIAVDGPGWTLLSDDS